MLVLGVAPVLAPTIGGEVLRFTSWRGVFVVLAVLALMLVVVAAVALPETLPAGAAPPARPSPAPCAPTAACCATARSSASSSSPAWRCPGCSATSRAARSSSRSSSGSTSSSSACSSVPGALPDRRHAAQRRPAAPVRAAGAAAVRPGRSATRGGCGTAATGRRDRCRRDRSGWSRRCGRCCSPSASCLPNAPALALARHGEAAGTASALLGAVQMGVGAIVSPLVGLLGNDALAMGARVTGGATVRWSCSSSSCGRGRSRTSRPDGEPRQERLRQRADRERVEHGADARRCRRAAIRPRAPPPRCRCGPTGSTSRCVRRAPSSARREAPGRAAHRCRPPTRRR